MFYWLETCSPYICNGKDVQIENVPSLRIKLIGTAIFLHQESSLGVKVAMFSLVRNTLKMISQHTYVMTMM